jgi:hypothetical protein
LNPGESNGPGDRAGTGTPPLGTTGQRKESVNNGAPDPCLPSPRVTFEAFPVRAEPTDTSSPPQDQGSHKPGLRRPSVLTPGHIHAVDGSILRLERAKDAAIQRLR